MDRDERYQLQEALAASRRSFQEDEDRNFEDRNAFHSEENQPTHTHEEEVHSTENLQAIQAIADHPSMTKAPDSLVFIHLMLRNRCVPIVFAKQYFFKDQNIADYAVENILASVTNAFLSRIGLELSVVDDPFDIWPYKRYIILHSSIEEHPPMDCMFADSLANTFTDMQIPYFNKIYDLLTSTKMTTGICYNEIFSENFRTFGEEEMPLKDAYEVIEQLKKYNWIYQLEEGADCRYMFGPSMFRVAEPRITANSPLCGFCQLGVVSRTYMQCDLEACNAIYHTKCVDQAKLIMGDEIVSTCMACKTGKLQLV